VGEGKFEVAQIREILREVGRFGGIMRLLFIAENTSPEGTETIAMTSGPGARCTPRSYRPCWSRAGSRSGPTRADA
jgi:hypothetical protein